MCRHRVVCVGCAFHNHHIPSACILLHLSVPADLPLFLWFQNTCSYRFKYVLYSPCWLFLHKLTNLPARVVFTPSPNPVKTFTSTTCSALEPLVSDSPVLCWAGCWATVSLLALCPMLWLLSLLACRALPLSGPAAGEENLKPPHSSPSRHGSSCNSSLSSLLTCVV